MVISASSVTVKLARNGFENGIKLKRGKQRGSPSAEEDGVRLQPRFVFASAITSAPLSASCIANIPNLSTQCIDISRDGSFLTRVGIKVAVGAAMCAEWYVQI
jgi:hypothetical protein